MPAHTEVPIRQLCAQVLAAKTPEEVDRLINELRTALEEHVVSAKDSLEVQASNIAVLDVVAHRGSSRS